MNRNSTAKTVAGLAITLSAVGIGALLTARAKATKPSPDDAPDYTGRHPSGEMDVEGCTVTVASRTPTAVRIRRAVSATLTASPPGMMPRRAAS